MNVDSPEGKAIRAVGAKSIDTPLRRVKNICIMKFWLDPIGAAKELAQGSRRPAKQAPAYDTP